MSSSNITPTNKQSSILGSICGWVADHSYRPVVTGYKAVSGAKRVFSMLIANGPTPPIIQNLFEKLEVRKFVGEGPASLLKRIASNVTRAATQDSVLYYRGKDLNPLHSKEKPAEQTIPSASTPVVNHTQSAIPAPISPSQVQMDRAKIDRLIQTELAPQNIEKHKVEAKKKALETLYPVIINYAKAYWLFTSTLGLELDQKGENNQTLMEVVCEIRNTKKLNNKFSLNLFKEILQKRGIKLSTWQKIKLTLHYHLFSISWITSQVIPLICDKGIDLLYDHLFGAGGKKQENLLVKGLEKISTFLDKYARLLDEYKKNPPPGKTQADFITDLINGENIQDLYEEFSETLVSNFLPSINKDLTRPQIEKIKKSMNISNKSSFFTKISYFIVTLPLRIIGWIGWLIERPIIQITKSMVKDVGPTIVESTIETLQSPTTQMSINQTLVDVLKDVKKSMEDGSVNQQPILPFSAAKNSNIHLHLKRLSESLNKILALRTPDPKVEPNTFLERWIQRINLFGNLKLGEKCITEPIIASALMTAIPEGCMTFFSRYLHPKEFTTDIFSVLINATCNAFAPSPLFNEEMQRKKTKIDQELHDITHQLTTIAVKDALKNSIEKDYQTLIPSNLECPTIEKEKIPKDQLIDVEELIEKSLVPRIRDKYIKEGIFCLYDENLVRYGLLHIIRLVTTL